jgi:hypothetical protein
MYSTSCSVSSAPSVPGSDSATVIAPRPLADSCGNGSGPCFSLTSSTWLGAVLRVFNAAEPALTGRNRPQSFCCQRWPGDRLLAGLLAFCDLNRFRHGRQQLVTGPEARKLDGIGGASSPLRASGSGPETRARPTASRILGPLTQARAGRASLALDPPRKLQRSRRCRWSAAALRSLLCRHVSQASDWTAALRHTRPFRRTGSRTSYHAYARQHTHHGK